jgi:hypothetical protein
VAEASRVAAKRYIGAAPIVEDGVPVGELRGVRDAPKARRDELSATRLLLLLLLHLLLPPSLLPLPPLPLALVFVAACLAPLALLLPLLM